MKVVHEMHKVATLLLMDYVNIYSLVLSMCGRIYVEYSWHFQSYNMLFYLVILWWIFLFNVNKLFIPRKSDLLYLFKSPINHNTKICLDSWDVLVQPQHMILSMDITDECEEQQERVDQKSIHSSSSGLAKCIKKNPVCGADGRTPSLDKFKGEFTFSCERELSWKLINFSFWKILHVIFFHEQISITQMWYYLLNTLSLLHTYHLETSELIGLKAKQPFLSKPNIFHKRTHLGPVCTLNVLGIWLASYIAYQNLIWFLTLVCWCYKGNNVMCRFKINVISPLQWKYGVVYIKEMNEETLLAQFSLPVQETSHVIIL